MRKLLSILEARSLNLLLVVVFGMSVVFILVSSSVIGIILDPGRSPTTIIWDSIKALLGPDYLDDTHGTVLTAVSLVSVIMGMAVLQSGIFVVVLQLVQDKVKEVREGLGNVPFEGHTVILNWGHRTVELVEELVECEYARDIVVLSKEPKDVFEEAVLKHVDRTKAKKMRILYRQGSTLVKSDLQRVNISTAKCIIVTSPLGGAKAHDRQADMGILKTLMLLYQIPGLLAENVLAEIENEKSAADFRSVLKHDSLHFVCSRTITGRVLGHCALQPCMASVFDELFSQRGDELYIKRVDVSGLDPAERSSGLQTAEFMDVYMNKYGTEIPVGLCDEGKAPDLNPSDWRTRSGTMVVLAPFRGSVPETVSPATSVVSALSAGARSCPDAAYSEKVLLIGSNSRLEAMLSSLARFTEVEPRFSLSRQITVHALSPSRLPHRLLSAEGEQHSLMVTSQVCEQPVSEECLIEQLSQGYDSIVLLPSEGVSRQEVDCDVLAAAFRIRELLDTLALAKRPKVIAELLDENDTDILKQEIHHGLFDVIVSNRLVSRYIARCVEEPRIRDVLENLLDMRKQRLCVSPLDGCFEGESVVGFREIVQAFARADRIALGYVSEAYDVRLGPPFSEGVAITGGAQVIWMGNVTAGGD